MYSNMQYSDWTWIWIMLAVGLLGTVIQITLQNRFKKYSKIATVSGQPARVVAQQLLAENDCGYMQVKSTPGALTDHFDPRTETINLSDPVYDSDSIAAVSVAAHECGHAMQYEKGYFLMKIRTALVPAVNFTSKMVWPIIIVGLILGMGGTVLVNLGIILYAVTFLFQLVTLPVEINASRRALANLESNGYIQTDEEIQGSRKVLTAAALTYVVAALASMVQLLRLLSIASSRNRD